MKNYAAIWKKESDFIQMPYEDFVTEFPNPPNLFMLEKLDGMLGAFIYNEGKKSFFQTTRGHEIYDVPVINEYEILLRQRGVRNAIITGELVAKVRGKILPFNETMSIVKTSYRPQNKDLIHHYPFDIYEIDDTKPNFQKAIQLLSRFVKKSGLPHIHLPAMGVGDLRIFRFFYRRTKEKDGFDGVVIRGLKGKNYKVKFTNTADVLVIGAGKEGLPAWGRNQVSYLMTGFIDRDGNVRVGSKVGTGFSSADRSSFYQFVQKNKWYEEEGLIYIRPQLIIEVKYFRYRITEMPILSIGRDKYIQFGKRHSVTFSHPSFERKREDKKPNKVDTRLEQFPDWVY
jgi:ATP-dependent DNA ligase